MLIRTISIICLVLAASSVFAQSAKKKKDKQPKAHQTADPYFPEIDFAPEHKKSNKSKGITYNAEKNFYKRREEVEKDKRKAEKEMLKPQYSDPMYFGHKRPPKKHKPGKMKFCKVCGIRH